MNNENKKAHVIPLFVSGSDKKIQENRAYFKCIAETIVLCARQEISLRGDNESYSSANRGNFLEMFHMMIKDNELFKTKAQSGNCKYTSPEMQNEIL